MLMMYLGRGSSDATASTTPRAQRTHRRIPRPLSYSQQVARNATIVLSGTALLLGASVAAQALVMGHDDFWQAGMIVSFIGGVIFNLALAKDSRSSLEHLSDGHIYRAFLSFIFTVLMLVNFVGIYLVAKFHRSYLILPVISMICLYFALVSAHFPIRKLNKCGSRVFFVCHLFFSLLIPFIIMPPPEHRGKPADHLRKLRRNQCGSSC
ncbi:hypothetical protein PMAYCL1PPCAC_09957 [Pristionchus mayeri]|uniref:Uncharacterized protein n=1 Tax=Pristionchus mayeri TaxID=1317129 RepID=A0AAN4ZKC0_9BILA|nr:hypothetical protein PMAYCL1PPCAC_09957 [Pristionchus mayeri]